MAKIGNKAFKVQTVVRNIQKLLPKEVARQMTMVIRQTGDGDHAELSYGDRITIQVSQRDGDSFAEMFINSRNEVFNKTFVDSQKAAALIVKKLMYAHLKATAKKDTTPYSDNPVINGLRKQLQRLRGGDITDVHAAEDAIEATAKHVAGFTEPDESESSD
jgi:hypothetical protein